MDAFFCVCIVMKNIDKILSHDMIMIGIIKNAIIFLEVKILIDKSEIADYLSRAKKLIVQNKFCIALNSNE